VAAAATAAAAGGLTLRRRAGVPILLALLLASGAQAVNAAVEGFHYTREVQVPTPGWVRVPLDLAAIQHLAPGAVDLHVISPAGGEIPVRLESAAPRSERRPVKSSTMDRDETGWSLLLDLGQDPIPHERLFLRTARPGLTAPERIESSPDGSNWQPLSLGEPFQTDAGEGWAAISYPGTEDRWLRLHWPRQAGAPRIAAAEAESVTGPTLAIATRNADCEPGPAAALFCNLPLPAAGQIVRRLTVEVEGKGGVGYRLDAPREARWRSLVEGIWQGGAGGRARHVLPAGPDPVTGDLLRLELYAASGAAPRLTSYGIELTVQTVLFDAEEAGRYTLAYGGSPRRAAPGPAAPAGVEPVWLEAGHEIEHAPPPLPATATAPGVRLATGRLKASWRVVALAARPGSLVRLELPEPIYAFSRVDLGNLRLVAGDRQIPYFLWSPDTPALALWEGSVQPTGEGKRAKESELGIRLPRPSLPLTELDLMAPARPLHRDVVLRYMEPAALSAPRRREERKAPPSLRETWECMPQPPIPCRLRLPLPGRAPSVLSLRFRDGDNPPLADLDAAVWRRRDVLLFVWPETVSVRLLAGPDMWKAPSYDLQALGDTLLSQPWQPAEISTGGARSPGSEPWWSRWMRPVILGVACLWLILLLRRILTRA
jgi:Protein of unknown function (DUF3999)